MILRIILIVFLMILALAGVQSSLQAQDNESNTQKSQTVSGIVKERNGPVIIGATVLIKGTVDGVLTDADGKYSIKAKVGDVIEIRLIGYNTVEFTVRDEEPLKDIEMFLTDIDLKEIVVVGYGQQKAGTIVSAINTVSAREMRMPTRSLSNAIAGRVAGVMAFQRSGEPGNDDAQFWIRGQSSFAGGTGPLVLIDGIPRSMNDLDVDEIETFSVLKDAAATAVYGAEGANGVILVTTKRGKSQKTIISGTAQYSIVSPNRMPKLLNSYQYLSLYNEAKWNEDDVNNAVHIPAYSDEILGYYRDGTDPDLYPSVNWMDQLANSTNNQRYTINLRGGAEKAKFFVSSSFYRENGIYKSNTMEEYDANIGLQRYNLRANLDIMVTPNTELIVDISGQYKNRNGTITSADNMFSALTLFPVHLIPLQYSNGEASDHPLSANDRFNPYNLLNYMGYRKIWESNLQTKVALKQKLEFITRGLSVRGLVSFDTKTESVMFRGKSPRTLYYNRRDADGNLTEGRIRNEGTALSDPYTNLEAPKGDKNIYLEAAFDYSNIFNTVHDVTGLLLYNQKETQNQTVRDGKNLTLLPYRKQSIVARGTYAYDKRYILEGSFGATGSENFLEGRRWGIFPSVGVSWWISQEKFFERMQKHVDKFRLRASMGLTGNDKLGQSERFPYREQLNDDAGRFALGLTPGVGGGTTNSYVGVTERTFASPLLTWETERKMNLGIDLGLLGNRIDLSFDVFSNRRKDILLNRETVPSAAGFIVNVTQNYGVTSNKGFDGNISLNHDFGDFHLSAMGNITYAKNKVIERDEIPQLYSYQNRTGRRIGQPRLYIAEGLYTPDDFDIVGNDGNPDKKVKYILKPHLPQPSAGLGELAPGDIKYKDLNNDGIIDAYDMSYDHKFFPTRPSLQYGFGVSAEWKGIFGKVFFQGTGRTSANLLAKVANFIPFYNGVDNNSARIETLDRWTNADPYNDDVLYPRMRTARFDPNLLPSTWWYRNASFLRLKDIEFGYQFDKKLTRNFGVQNLKLYVQATNVAIWDNIKYWDPEQGGDARSGAKYPISGTWTFGLEVTF